LGKGQWQVGLAYRRLTADQWFVGTEIREDQAPFGQPLLLNINSIDFTAYYGVTDRLSLSLTLPFSTGTHSRFYADGARHRVSASGLGDVSLTGNFWLFDPEKHSRGNLSLQVGVKAPTGKNDAVDDYFLASGKTSFAVDQAIQLGDGGWGILLQMQAFQELFSNAYGYAYGSYLASPRNQSDVVRSPGSSVRISVPDVYSGRLGLSYAVLPKWGVSASFGGRVDGLPSRDLIGGSDGFRRPIVVAYVDPGVSLRLGGNTLFVNVPIRVYADFIAGAGDLAKYLIYAGVDHRF